MKTKKILITTLAIVSFISLVIPIVNAGMIYHSPDEREEQSNTLVTDFKCSEFYNGYKLALDDADRWEAEKDNPDSIYPDDICDEQIAWHRGVVAPYFLRLYEECMAESEESTESECSTCARR